MKIVTIFRILAVALAAAAAIFLWRQNTDYAFAAGVLGICSYFLSMRFEMKARVDQYKKDAEIEDDE